MIARIIAKRGMTGGTMPLTDAKYVDVDGIGTRYFVKGEGEPLVLVHGGHMGTFAADLADDWDLNFDALAERYRVYALDKLGMGFTDNPGSDEGYTIQAQTDHVSRFLDALDIGPAHLCGHSRGGYLVCRLTLQHPEQARSCIIVDSGTLSPGAGRNEIVHANPPLPLRSRECHRWVFERYSYSPACVTEGWLDIAVEAAHTPKYDEAVRKMSDEGLLATRFLPDLQRDLEETHRWLLERGIERPTLMLWGYNDPTAPLSQGMALMEFLTARQRRTYLHIFNESGHFCYREHPEAFNAAVHAFTESCVTR